MEDKEQENRAIWKVQDAGLDGPLILHSIALLRFFCRSCTASSQATVWQGGGGTEQPDQVPFPLPFFRWGMGCAFGSFGGLGLPGQ